MKVDYCRALLVTAKPYSDEVQKLLNQLNQYCIVEVAVANQSLSRTLRLFKPDILIMYENSALEKMLFLCKRLSRDFLFHGLPIAFYVMDEADGNPDALKACTDYWAHALFDKDILGLNKSLRYQRRHSFMDTQEHKLFAFTLLVQCITNYGGFHTMRTQYLIKLLADEMTKRNLYPETLTVRNNELLTMAALLHDIGKFGVSETILKKPGKLTKEEFEVVKTHTTLGRNALLQVQQMTSVSDSKIRFALEAAYSHHEKWDGTGYPQGLRGEQIPVSARLMAVVDVYDALVSKRVYKEAFPHELAVSMICEQAGKHFDPAVVDVFLSQQTAFRDFSLCYTALVKLKQSFK